MNIQEELKSVVNLFCNMKKMICEHENGPHDLTPMMHFKYQHLNAPCGGLLMGDPFEMAPMLWRKVLDDGIPEFMMLMMEGYSSTTMPNAHGELERDFKENPNSTVREVITVHAIDIKTGNQFTAVVPFKYGDSGLPEFDKPSIGPCEGEALQSRVAMMFSACRNATVNFLQEAA